MVITVSYCWQHDEGLLYNSFWFTQMLVLAMSLVHLLIPQEQYGLEIN